VRGKRPFQVDFAPIDLMLRATQVRADSTAWRVFPCFERLSQIPK
jgi:hypothetical protein